MEEKNLKEKVDETYDFIERVKAGKIKKLKIPRKAKVSRSKMKKGYIGVLKIDENGNISGEKHKLSEGTYELDKTGTFHCSNASEILMWNGKHPVVIQPTWSKNPLDVRKLKPTQETYGQKLIIAKMLKSVLVMKKSGGKALFWILGIIAAIVAYSLLSGGTV